MAGIDFTQSEAPLMRHSRARIQAYAMLIVLNGAQSAVEDDLDEDGHLNCSGGCDHSGLCPDHEAACTLAQKIADYLAEHWIEVLGHVEVPEPDLAHLENELPW